mmetsp:Transcript_37911/g.88623  ORF Transcript_37911/g.88623 Transcript_37911/m.88623 type:complete len:87 (+) Transcript_37911:1556-1816(+)
MLVEVEVVSVVFPVVEVDVLVEVVDTDVTVDVDDTVPVAPETVDSVVLVELEVLVEAVVGLAVTVTVSVVVAGNTTRCPGMHCQRQ